MNADTRQASSSPPANPCRLRRRQAGLRIGCILAGLFFIAAATGQDTVKPEENPAYKSHYQPATEYLDAIDRIEGDYGPYATELSDLYLGLGQVLLDNWEYERARDAFHRGVMVVRVNSGPNSPEQTNHLYLIANIEAMLGERRLANEVLDNIFFINSNYYGEDSPELLPVLDRMYQWYKLTHLPGSVDLDFGDYEKIVDLTENMVRISETAKGVHHSETAVAYHRHAEAQFQMVRHLTGSGMALAPDRYVAATENRLVPGDFASDPVIKHFKAGRKAFASYIEALETIESTTAPEVAEALAELGDWYLLFEKRRSSRQYYEQGYHLLLQNEEYAELAESYMSQPKPMHFIGDLEPGFVSNAPSDVEAGSLEISMTVTTSGEVRAVKVVNAPKDMPEDILQEIKSRVRETPFRPAMKEGEIVTTRDFIWRYDFARQAAELPNSS